MNTNELMPSNRKFGFFFTLIFSICGLYFFYIKFDLFMYIFISMSVLFFSITVTYPNLLFPLNNLWMNFGFFLGKIINPLVLGLIYFCLFVPISLFIRIIGRDELNLKIKKKNSFWIQKKPTNSDFNNQF